MKLQFKYQKFQADAAKAVADVFDDSHIWLAFLYDRGKYQGKIRRQKREKELFRMEQSEDRARIKR